MTNSTANPFSMAMPPRLTTATLMLDIGTEWTPSRPLPKSSAFERIFAVPDTRPLSLSHLAAANRRHDESSRTAHGFGFGSKNARLFIYLRPAIRSATQR